MGCRIAGTGARVFDHRPQGTAIMTARQGRLAALVLAWLMVAGSLFLSLGMGLNACPLCLYERTFVMSAAAVLLVGVASGSAIRPNRLCLLALPAAAGGLGVAAFHVYLDRTGVLDCPLGVFGIGTAPDQSLVGHVLLIVALGVGLLAKSAEDQPPIAVSAGSLALGLALAYGAIASAPPLPPPNPTFDDEGNRILSGCEPAIPDDFEPKPQRGSSPDG